MLSDDERRYYASIVDCGPQTADDLENMYRQRARLEAQRFRQTAEGMAAARATWVDRLFVYPMDLFVVWLRRVSGLLGVTIAWLLLFELCIAFWHVLFVTGVMPQSITEDDGARTAFAELTLIIGIIYYVWFREAIYGYPKGPTTYLALLDSINAYCRTLYQFLRASEPRADALPAATDAYYILQSLALYSLRLFTDHDPAVCASVRWTLGDSRALAAELVDEAHDGTPTDIVAGLVSMLQYRIRTLERLRQLSGSDTRELGTALIKLREALLEARCASFVATPRLMRVQVLITMIAYFFLWLPFIMYARIGVSALALYPIMMFLLWGVFIDKWYLGDAFAASSAWTGMDLPQWRSKNMESNARVYAMWIESLDTVTTAAGRDHERQRSRLASRCLFSTPTPPCTPLGPPPQQPARDMQYAGRVLSTDVTVGGPFSTTTPKGSGDFLVLGTV